MWWYKFYSYIRFYEFKDILSGGRETSRWGFLFSLGYFLFILLFAVILFFGCTLFYFTRASVVWKEKISYFCVLEENVSFLSFSVTGVRKDRRSTR